VSAFEVGAFEPATPTEPKLDMPPFPVVLRGFDRQQVKAWGKELASQIQQERLRAHQAEQALYHMQLRRPATGSFRHLGAHVGDVLDEAGRSAEKILVDAAERAQEAIDVAAADAAQIVAAAEQQAAEIRQAAHRILEESRAERARLVADAQEAAAGLHARAEQDAGALLEQTRQATEALWQQGEQDRLAVEAQIRQLQALRQRADDQLWRMYGHLASILEQIYRGIDGSQNIGEEAESRATAARATGRPAPAVELAAG
jgi:hypothetical protein